MAYSLGLLHFHLPCVQVHFCTILDYIDVIQTVALTAPLSGTVTGVYGASLSSNSAVVLSCLGIAMSSRIHFDIILASNTASGYTINFTLLSSAIVTSFTYTIRMYVFSVNLNVSLPFCLQNNIDMSTQIVGIFALYADSISASGATLDVPLL